jgi:4-amino-4-deoxy-L-arabinose transferase-like glycosyltransferase
MHFVAYTRLNFIQIVLSIPLLLFLPGYVTRLALLAYRSERIQADWLEFCFQCLLFSLLLTGWAGVTLVQLGWFSLPRLLLCNACYTLVLSVLAWRRRRLGWISPRLPDRSAWLLLGLLIVAAALFFHPHEFIFGGADAGVYVNLGANIARTGSWLVHDPTVAALDSSLYPALFREQPPASAARYIQFPGFYLADEQPGLIIPQFYPLHPTWLAILYSLGGVRASLFATPFWGLLGCVAVYLAARALFGRRTGLLAAGLLTITATQIWFSRYPTSEALTQFLLFSGIYTFTMYMADESLWMGLLSGLALGQVTLARIDVYFLLAVPVFYAIYLRLNRRLSVRHLAFFLPFLVMFVHSLLFAWFQSWPYFRAIYRFSLQTLPLPWPILAAIGIAGWIALLIFDHWAGKHPGWQQRLAPYGRWAATALAVLLVLATLYGYFIRPRLADTTTTAYYWYGDYNIPNVEPYNLVRLGWYISPLGIALAVLGAWWMLRHEMNVRTAFFLGLGLFFSFLFLHRSRNNPHHIYVMRRYVPAVIPSFAIAAAYALDTWLRRTGWRRWFAVGLTVVLAGWLLYSARVVIPHVEYRGAVKQFETLVNVLGNDRAVILFNDDIPVSTGATLGTPLHYLYGYTVFDLQEKYVDGPALHAQIERWQDAGRRVLVALGPDEVEGLIPVSQSVPVANLRLDVPVLEVSYEHFPRQIWRYTVNLPVYELAPLP